MDGFTYINTKMLTLLNACFRLLLSSSTKSWWQVSFHFLGFLCTYTTIIQHQVATAKEKLKWEKLAPRAQLNQTLITAMT